jgi:dTDP-N-acetylfucosamine:lipid II N-acetylfucosaminyltransferase
MNLHIVPDSKFTETFYSNLMDMGIASTNRFVVRSNSSDLKFVRHNLPVARLSSNEFDHAVGNTREYEHVFIHQFSPLMYRWVAENTFRKLSWCVWGADLYNLPGAGKELYENETWTGYSRHNGWRNDLLYTIKLYLTNMRFREKAYGKVDHVLTWMQSEFDYARNHLPINKASWKFFFYENQVPYEKLDELTSTSHAVERGSQKKVFVLGNSGTDTNNHVDAVRVITGRGMQADLIVPLSYGTPRYIEFVKKKLSAYRAGSITFLEDFMQFEAYLQMLSKSDGLIMNHVRPQGYGNIFMMMYLNKPVYLNSRNISLPDLDRNGLAWTPLSQIADDVARSVENRSAVRSLLSHQKLQKEYMALFS